MNPISYWQRLKVAFQYVMPQIYMTQAAGWLAKQKWGAVTHFVIKAFAKKYNIDMSIAEKEKFSDYASFNEKKMHDQLTKIQPHFVALRMAV